MSPNLAHGWVCMFSVALVWDMVCSFPFLSSHSRSLRIYGDWSSLQRQADGLFFSHSDSVTDGTAAVDDATSATRPARSQEPLVDFGFTKREQLWLDLRGTAVFPHEALQLLTDQFSDDGKSSSHAVSLDESVLHLIDGVLVSQEMFERIACHESQIMGKQSYLLLYATDHTQELVANCASAQMSMPVGKIVTVNAEQTDNANSSSSSSSIDPMVALDVVIDRKQWLLIDSNHRMDAEESALKFKGRVESLLQFLSASSRSSLASDSFISASGLILPGLAGSSTENFVSGSKTGGIAIACPDQNTFLKIDSLLAEFRSSLQTTTTTESGLLVPSQSPADAQTDGINGAASLPATALILPLDLRVWKTALALRRMIHEAGEADVIDLLP